MAGKNYAKNDDYHGYVRRCWLPLVKASLAN